MSSEMRNHELIKLAHTTRLASDETSTFILNYLRSLDCPRALTVWLLFSTGEHVQLSELEFDPLHYHRYEEFRDAYAAQLFLSKASFLNLPVSKKHAAFEKFEKFEDLCRMTNERFRNLSLDPSYKGPNVSLLGAMIRKIDSILTPFTAEEFVNGANWGPGSTTLLRGAEVSAFNKFRDERGITRDLYRLVKPWFSMAYPRWTCSTTGRNILDSELVYEIGNRVITVPKNSKTDRVIAIEPGLNQWVQKSIGEMIRKRLRREGIDLNSQTLNQQLAERGSFTNRLATVDFSSASDSIAKYVVRTVIRDSRWLALLESSRSRYGKIGNRVLKWQKFSSMGNGFTFELESLIFYAAAFACCEYLGVSTRQISVFGDDVIIPEESYALFTSFSEFLGFKVNRAKSFSSGYFRESCGSHFYNGRDCKPIYLKDRLTSVISLYKLANAVRNLSHRRSNYCGCDDRFLQYWASIVRRIPKPLRLWVSAELGDVGLQGNLDEACPTASRSTRVRQAGRGFEGFRITILAQLGVTLESEDHAMLLARLWGRPKGATVAHWSDHLAERPPEYGNSYTLRGKTKLVIKNDVLVSQWYNFGEWVGRPPRSARHLLPG